MRIQEVVNQNIVAAHGVNGLILKCLLSELAHVLLTQGICVVGDVASDLLRSVTGTNAFHNSGSNEMSPGILTNCSVKGTLLSLSLWTSAEAQPSSTEAASREVFMMGDRSAKGVRKRNERMNFTDTDQAMMELVER